MLDELELEVRLQVRAQLAFREYHHVEKSHTVLSFSSIIEDFCHF